jgi:phosphopantetheinyl transferase
MIDSMLIATDYFQEKVISPEQAIQPWEWDFNIGFEGEDIIIRNRDSLSFNISLKYLSHP